ncbi:hypothetical protein ACJIZ3_009228 [Penstemon smallii]|uniref:RRM domain-containing protein n=1 Tax=Penstemon smallii TaxID=265156 RepID=A0ABD3TCF8_9LAMI
MVDERDAEDAIRALDRIAFGRAGRRLRVEWTKQDRNSRRPEISRKSSSNTRPTKTLFVINFDPYHTRTRDLERHFDPYGKILNVRIRRNFAFIQFESQEEATKALDATNLSKLLDRVITVEYAVKDDDDRRNGSSPDRTRDRSPRRANDRVRSPSPYSRERGSPDYGHGRAHGRSPSRYRRERASPDYVRGPSRSPSRKERDPEYSRGRSPSPRKERDHKHSPIPERERANGEDIGNGLNLGKKVSPDYVHSQSPGPRREQRERVISPTDDYAHSPSPSPQREQGERVISPSDDYGREKSPAYSDGESPQPGEIGSQSPPARERSRS